MATNKTVGDVLKYLTGYCYLCNDKGEQYHLCDECQFLKTTLRQLGEMIGGAIISTDKKKEYGFDGVTISWCEKDQLTENLTSIGLPMGEGKGE